MRPSEGTRWGFESHTDHTYARDSPSLVFSSNLPERVIRLDFLI